MSGPHDISLTMIVRDESSTIEPLLKKVRPHVQEIVIVDTGSVDGTPEICRKYADRFEVFLGCNNPETNLIDDFAVARNRSLELASCPWVLWLDGDDDVVGIENIQGLVRSTPRDVDLCHYIAPYEYLHDPEGNCIVLHHRERLAFPRHRHQWQLPIHEGLLPKMPLEGGPLVTIPTEAFRVVHRQTKSTKPREEHRNLRILKEYVRKHGEGDTRMLYYLGVETLASKTPGNVGDGMRYLRRYIELAPPYEDERCLAMLDIARAFRALGDEQSAIDWAGKAQLAKFWTAPYFELAQCFFDIAEKGVEPDYNFRRCAAFAKLGLSINPTGAHETVQAQNPKLRFQIHEILNVALSRIDDIKGALWSCEEGLRGLPKSEMLLHNKATYEAELAKEEKRLAKDRINRDVEGLVAAGDLSPAAAVIMRATLAGDFQVELMPRPVDMPSARVAAREPAPGKLDIVFFTGLALEPWNPPFLEANGMGGSETMAWELSRRLARLGHRVRLYGHCTPSMEGLFDGVEWLDGSRFRGVRCDILISSRRPDAVDDVHGCKAGARILWVHDVNAGEALTMARDLRFDRVFALSNWHKGFLQRSYPRMDPTKIVVTRNGIDLSRFDGEEPRNPHRCVWGSSPDRGLRSLLEMWPKIRERVPDADLVVTYGFENWSKTAELNGWTDHAQLIRHLKHLVEHTAGVTLLGRIPQRRLAREYMRSGVLAYSTWFGETSCLTAMEAQASGLRIVSSAIAALNETVADRGILLDWGSPFRENPMEPTPEYREAFVDEVVRAMTAAEDSLGWPSAENTWTREGLAAYAREHFCLDKLAEDWSEMLTAIHADVSASVVPKFHDAPLPAPVSA